MAAGDVHIFAKYDAQAADLLGGDWGTNTIKMGIITNATVPTTADSDPRWGAGGTQNYAAVEVTPGGNYSAGGITLSGTTISLSSSTVSLNATSPISLAAHASNPTGAYRGIFYDSTSAGKEAFGWVELGTAVDLTVGLQLNINGVSSGTQPIFHSVSS